MEPKAHVTEPIYEYIQTLDFLLSNCFVSLGPVWQLGQPGAPLLSKGIQQPLIRLVASDVRRWKTVVKGEGVP